MSALEVVILAFALALDATIVSFSYGLALDKNRVKSSLTLAGGFGFFQFLMPVIGWYLSALIYRHLEDFSKWIVFLIFLYLAFKFIKSATGDEKVKIECITLKCLLWLSVATSIDALGAGISLKFSGVNVLMPSVTIGVITFLCSLAGFWFANSFKKLPSKYLELTGAVLFIYLAVKALI